MKNRWIGGFLLAAVLALAACQPQNQGGGSPAEPSQAAPASAEPMSSDEPAKSEDDSPGGYDY